jgi:CDP-glucose 4,6-dehydratase
VCLIVQVDPRFWTGKRVLVTGHTGFKGAWLSLWLVSMGARVRGYADEIPTQPSLFELSGLADEMESVTGDVADGPRLREAMRDVDVALHLAAQPFVRRSFREPVLTWRSNVLGTCEFLEAIRDEQVRSSVVITSDKCYANNAAGPPRAFVETDPMGGHDPYSSSKGAAELAVDAWRRSYELPVATGRAGNVVGGGDWGEDRLVADIMRAAQSGAAIPIRNPDAVRPWQHVLEPLSGYLVVAQGLWDDRAFGEPFNFGPAAGDARPVRWVTEQLTELWPDDLAWEVDPGPHPHEAPHLALDSSKARERLGWTPAWDLDAALRAIVAWHVAYREGADVRATTLAQIERRQAGLAPE